MAGFITIKADVPEKEWSSANWVFVGFLDHAISVMSEDAEAVHELTSCKFNQSVDLDELTEESPDLAKRIVKCFELSCSQIAGENYPVSVNGNELNQESQYQYREAIGRLEKMLALERLPKDE